MHGRQTTRVALVTGGAVRLGRAITLGLAEAGYDVVVAHHTSARSAAAVCRDVETLGRRSALAPGDLADPAVAEDVVRVAEREFGRLDLLVNGAASFDARPLLDVDAAAWDRVMRVNLRAPHLTVRAAAPLLRAARGSVVNLVDLSAFQPWTEHPHHAVSKAALAHLTRLQARALAPEVRVNAVAPGAVLPPEAYDAERRAALAASVPLGRLGTPDDVVRAVLFLAGAPYVTGHVLTVDGGRLLGPAG